ncbi:hypothetical protein M409DRAFT_16959 [Zasmidium cellare ATCC 36951]|uniref:Exoribonuclease phosphorolytic domain-containing protein n=1 Tax=Zasmidium cellare ATCC 36951 TaxID=1080233 RepID=A0A6A6D4F8_ZASCE|nr:uncharacterized protein M409DRAFT_16959 [Zasmidium cellare ATCC 36951]KAF2173009.1 hypothetical protein M409DRAFT_16959 [Zasmidium cellare ATCC 36951]
MGPDLVHHPLSRADGSTVLSSGPYTVIAGVNGPIEVQRRDELPEEAAIEVNLRPASGVGGPRERWLETVLQSVLKSIVLVHMFPRTLVQITLQITKEPSMKLRRTSGDISLIPTLLNAAVTSLVDGGIPLAMTSSAILATVSSDGRVVLEPQEKEIASCKSTHAMAFSANGEQLLNESSGNFNFDKWSKVADMAKQASIAAIGHVGEDTAMSNGGAQTEPWLRQALEDEAKAAGAWREAT